MQDTFPLLPHRLHANPRRRAITMAALMACMTLPTPAASQDAPESQPEDAPSAASQPAVESPASELEAFEVTALGGRVVRSADMSKQVVLIDCFGTWCPPCREAIPVLTKLHRKYAQYGLEIVGIAFERVDDEEAIDVLRKFAQEHDITYPLALGTDALREQFDVKSFPTLVRVGKGLRVLGTDRGFKSEDAVALEVFVRSQLGLDVDLDNGTKEDEPEVIPAGKLFQPGNGDSGFEFNATTIQGTELSMESFRGSALLLAITSSWDKSAVDTAAQLQAWHTRFVEDGKLTVLAASFERVREDEAKQEALVAFTQAQSSTYPAFPIGLPFTRKLHRWSSLPTWLLFDEKGKLVLRETGLAADVTAAIEAKLKER